MKVLFPTNRRDPLEAVLINTSGGITGGDRFRVEATVERDASLTMTTQAAERAYRAQPGEMGSVETRLDVQAGARLNWLPQELITYQSTSLERRLKINLELGAQLLMVEPIIFGRSAMGEEITDLMFRDRIEIDRDNSPLFRDSLHLEGNLVQHMSENGYGASAMASLVFCAPDAHARLSRIQDHLVGPCAANAIHDDLIFIRLLADDGFALRQRMIPILRSLSDMALPKTWMT